MLCPPTLLFTKVTVWKVLATIFCVAGTLVVSFSKAGASGNHSNHSNNYTALMYSDGNDDVFGPPSWAEQEPAAASPETLLWSRVMPGHPAGASAYAAYRPTGSDAGVSGGDASDGTGPIVREGFGYAMCFLSTALYAIFEVAYKKWATHEDDPFPVANSQRFLGLIGCSVMLLAWIFPILNAYPRLTNTSHPVEVFEWPTGEAARMIGINVALDTVFNVSFLIAILLTSPLFVSLATIGTIPVSIITDHLMGKPPLPHIAYLGVVSIAVGFSCLGIDARRNGSSH